MNVDPNTGEVISGAIQPWYKRQIDASKATPINSVLGDRPVYMNLRDHPELDGRSILILRYETSTGDYGEFIKVACILLKSDGTSDAPVVIMTGAADIVERLNAISDLLDAGQPVKATLHQAGRAWLLE